MCPTPNQSVPEPLLTEQQVAKLLSVSVATIRRRRLLRHPPDFIKIGSSVRYRHEAVELLISRGEHNVAEPIVVQRTGAQDEH